MLVFGGVILLRGNVRVKYSKVVLVTPSFSEKDGWQAFIVCDMALV